MAIPPILVKAARQIWNFEWKILMNGLAPSDSKGNYKRPINLQKQIKIPTKEDLKNGGYQIVITRYCKLKCSYQEYVMATVIFH